MLRNLKGGNALQLEVGDGIAPMKVNSDAKVAKLNADKVDGSDAPLWAQVSDLGGLSRSKGATSSTKTSLGKFEVVFNKNVRNCVYTATLGGENRFFYPPGVVQTTNHGSNVNAVLVKTEDLEGRDVDLGFYLVVNC